MEGVPSLPAKADNLNASQTAFCTMNFSDTCKKEVCKPMLLRYAPFQNAAKRDETMLRKWSARSADHMA